VEKFDPSKVDARRVRAELGLPPETFVVGCVGRLVLEKGFAELFQAAEQLSRDDELTNLRFLIIGPQEPDQSDAVDPVLFESLQARGVVQFLGYRDDVRELYSVMDVLVLPSHREGIPRACMEAAAMQVPILATRIRGNREVVIDGVTGVLVPVRDAEAIAAGVRGMYRTRERLPEMGRLGREHIIANFSQRDVLARLRDFYRRLQAVPSGRNGA
jgi:glycosyltransferase involved in cell wall biosynthesis